MFLTKKKHPAENLSAFRHLRKLKCITKTVYNTIGSKILFKKSMRKNNSLKTY